MVLLTGFGLILVVVVELVIFAEWLGLLDSLTKFIPWPIWLAGILAGGYPIFRTVARATLRGKVTSHTLMTAGLTAAILAGAWPAGVIIVFFMRLADYIEQFTAEHARKAVRGLTALAPEMARVERDGAERQVPIAEVRAGDIVIVRPGEKIPVDGKVIGGQATVNQAAITGESMPVEAGPGARVFAASFAQLGHLRIRVTAVGSDTTFGRVIKMVEEADQHRADVQRIADRFATWYLPFVAVVAAITLLSSRNPIAAAAVLMVACSCSFALATPVAMIASIGASARRGLLIKGGRYLESLAKADVVLLDKTGTLTLGRPQITDVVPLDGSRQDANVLLTLAATAERYSEHPLAEAVRNAAAERGLQLGEPEEFEAVPGAGVQVRINSSIISVGSRRLVAGAVVPSIATELEAAGKTLLFVARDGRFIGVLAVMDTLRADVPDALAELRAMGIKHLELLTGDNERTAAALAKSLGIEYRANLLPEDKIAIVKEYQSRGHVVVMIGDGVNDAPALAQADIGIAMGAAGSGIAIEAAHIALMRENWWLVPEVVRISRRTMTAVKINVAVTAVYNLTGLTLAALGLLPPRASVCRRAAASREAMMAQFGTTQRRLRGSLTPVLALMFLLVPSLARSGAPDGHGQFFPSQGHCHIGESCPPRADSYEDFPYNSDPPTSGPHEERFPTTFTSESPLPKRILVHILEHRNVLILYNRNASTAQIEKLRSYAQRYDFRFLRLQQPLSPGADVGEQLEAARAVFVAPYPAMSHTMALVAWTRLETLDAYDEDRINRFAKAWVGNADNARQ